MEYASTKEDIPLATKKVAKLDMAKPLVGEDKEHSETTRHNKLKHMTVLQQHVSYFDRNGDGIVYPWEIYSGLTALGIPRILSLIAAIGGGMAFSYYTLPGWIPSPLFPVYIKNIHKDRHGSDTGTYDRDGRFNSRYFDEIFTKYASAIPDKLSLLDIWRLTQGNQSMFDPFGWLATKLEWGFLYIIACDDEGFLSKEDAKSCFDGSLFRRIERRRRVERHHSNWFSKLWGLYRKARRSDIDNSKDK